MAIPNDFREIDFGSYKGIRDFLVVVAHHLVDPRKKLNSTNAATLVKVATCARETLKAEHGREQAAEDKDTRSTRRENAAGPFAAPLKVVGN